MRKEPKQQRSREMVDRIVAAGREVLIRDGYAAFSTNRVADRAGISPGSFYQYFRDKQALLAVIVDGYLNETAERVAASLAGQFGEPPERLVSNTAEALVSALEQDSQLLRVVVEEIPQSQLRERRLALRHRVEELGSAYLAMTSMGERAPRMAWMVVTAMEALVVRWVIDKPPIPRDEFVAELTRLGKAYVVRRK